MKYILLLILFFLNFISLSQSDSLKVITLDNVTVTAYLDNPANKTSLNILSLKIDSLSRFGNYNLTDLMAKVPGINMLSTGVAIAKPVIRGLYGNRVLVLLSGLKFDNQQWQEEHGLGLSDIGLAKVELIKGPMGILYGTEAIGGIINLIEEEKPKTYTYESDIGLKFNTNTLGGQFQVGYKANYGKKWFRIRVALENNADYADGKNNRVLNSRFDGYNLKSTLGFQKRNWTSTNNLLSSFNRFGFIFNDIYTFIKPDDRWNRKLNVNPAHLVILNILSSENKIDLQDSKLNFNVGIQSNKRLENEGGGAISLNMHLFTFQYLLKWEKPLSEKNRLIISNLGSYENNTNYGARKIVPDADMQESNLSAYLESSFKNLILENGIGIGEKSIKTFLTPSVNSAEKDIHPFSKFAPYYNFFTGFTYLPNDGFNIKANIATGVRIPNLAELSSNGLHEGVFTYEIGNPKFKNEKNIALNLLLNYKNKIFELSISPFLNLFQNYVYLAPTNEDWFGFPVNRFKQQNANQFGTEFSVTFKPTTQIQTVISYSGMVSKTADGNFTPYIPAQKMTPNVYYSLKSKNASQIHFYFSTDYYFAQNNAAPNEIKTPKYALLNAGVSTDYKRNGKIISISLAGNNLLNKAYYDHLSRFKYFGLLNIGRNFSVNCKIHFGNKLN